MRPEIRRVLGGHNVSRETCARLERYAELLLDWQQRMNLVAPSTLPAMWERHFADSAQLFPRLRNPEDIRLLDMGSGAGFPGLVLAILGVGQVHLVDSTAKKCRFLDHVSRETGCSHRLTVHNARLDAMAPFPVDVITARACASLDQLFDWGHRFAARSTRWLLLKGARADAEVADAERRWTADLTLHPSLTDGGGRVLEAVHVARKGKKAR